MHLSRVTRIVASLAAARCRVLKPQPEVAADSAARDQSAVYERGDPRGRSERIVDHRLRMLRAAGGGWTVVDRARYCVPAGNIPTDIYDPGCTTN